MNAAAQPVARIAGLSHRYGRALALDGITLELPAGGMLGVIGPDGVGKSTLLGLIAGARKLQAGSLEVLGGDMRGAAHRHSVCPRIAYMPQGLGRNLYPTLSVGENLDFFARLFGQPRDERRARIKELTLATGLAPFVDRPAAKLSGGMKQKLGLCCALIHDPDLLILDEPTTGVDPLSRRQFWQLIERIRARRPGMSVLVATAYFDEAEAFDGLVAMNAGHVLAYDTPAKLKARSNAKSLEQAFVALLPQGKHARRTGARPAAPPTGARETAIEAHGLTRRFGDFVAVDHVSFSIPRGEIFGFLGSNGCGKTTTMKMLTGLLPVSAGSARLFGHPVDARDLATRKRVGFMSQAFSLYTELTMRQNLDLHARLFHLPGAKIRSRIAELVENFDLADYLDHVAGEVPLGVRQRLSLAVAVIHEPEMLILDEPTSGVDPVARDHFWELLLDLARNRGVTIFISTHFMNEAERCDRISLMHAGKVLKQGTPDEIVRAAGAANLEAAFISYLEDAGEAGPAPAAAAPVSPPATQPAAATVKAFSFARLWAYARRETMEIRRDPIRLAFVLLGPVVLMIVFGYGITFDVENLNYAALDWDRTPESRAYLENYSSSRYFLEQPPLKDPADLEARLRAGRIKLAIEIPPGFGRDLGAGHAPEVAIWLDGAFPFRAETSRGYVEGMHAIYLRDLARPHGGSEPAPPADIEMRFRYNQDFKSVYAMVPGIIMLLLILIPPMMTALGVVREKELGSITNFYVTPTTGVEFLLGKQLPYIGLAFANFLSLAAVSIVLFQVPLKGSIAALIAGAAIYVTATTAFGLLASSFVRTQIAAIFAVAIISVMPAVQYSGFLLPVSSMSADAQAVARVFPSTYFQHVSIGTFTKALAFDSLLGDFLAMAVFTVVVLALARAALKTQEQ